MKFIFYGTTEYFELEAKKARIIHDSVKEYICQILRAKCANLKAADLAFLSELSEEIDEKLEEAEKILEKHLAEKAKKETEVKAEEDSE